MKYSKNDLLAWGDEISFRKNNIIPHLSGKNINDSYRKLKLHPLKTNCTCPDSRDQIGKQGSSHYFCPPNPGLLHIT